MSDIFSRNLLAPRAPYRYPKATHWHIRQVGDHEALPEQFKSQAKALRNCPDGFTVEGCWHSHNL